ncbi:cytochrome-c peroxidase [Archangium sp.]|uniref:cytochrome-c peroxidase n=1 Tax=Archangium sp. TaxID=1872627 RepID=UPI002D2919AB|nr:cytochrome c peroxidase [Archangium sp.]HYO55414.1 cytochrome c peroxidase [Archangium sp.]
MGCDNGDAAEDFPNAAELVQIKDLQLKDSKPPPDETNFLTASNADPVKVERAFALGKRLFSDPKFSSCGTVSCASCHQPPSYADKTPKSPGCNNGITARNAPSILNAGFRTWFHWDGHRDSLWSQATEPLTNPIEMGATPVLVRDVLQSDTAYREAYQAVFGKQPQEETDDGRLLTNFGKATAVYVRSLIKVKSPFDELLPGFIEAAERRDSSMTRHPLYEPLRVFVRKGRCIVCHSGPMFSKDEFFNIGVEDVSGDTARLAGVATVLADPFNALGIYNDSPNGAGHEKLFELNLDIDVEPGTHGGGPPLLPNLRTGTRMERLEGAFKTPSLRNIELTAPYMHTGDYPRIEDVVEFYVRGGGKIGTFMGVRHESIATRLSPAEMHTLVDFMKMLTGSESP